MSHELIYIADPMCSWCWGFSPVIDRVREHFKGALPMRLLMGGLRPVTTGPMSDAMKSDIRVHWQHVHKASGQPFNDTFFERETFVYNTEPASRAVVAVRHLDPGLTFVFLKKVQEAFYSGNCDVTDTAILARIAQDQGLDQETFTSEFKADRTRAQTWKDFEKSRRLGVTGFPTLLGGSDDIGYVVITAGYRPWERVREAIEDWRRSGDL